MIRLPDQNRENWDKAQIIEGQSLLRVCLARDHPGPYQLQAAISAVHSDASDASQTDWSQILTLYNHLMSIAPSPVVALNRAVAVAELEGAGAALDIVNSLDLPQYHLFHAVRADLLRRIGRDAEAAIAYRAAINKCENLREREFLEVQYQSIRRN